MATSILFREVRRAAPPRNMKEFAEVGVFLLLIVPSMVLSLFAVQQGSLGFVLVAFATIFRDVGLVSLVLYFLWRNGESITRVGWTTRDISREAILGCVLFVPFFFGAAALDRLLIRAGFSAPATPGPAFLEARGMAEAVLGTVLVAVVAVAEETIFRGYLILRSRGLAESGLGGRSFLDCFLRGSWLRGDRRAGHGRRDGHRLRRALSVAPQPGRTDCHALSSGFSQHRAAAGADGEVKRACCQSPSAKRESRARSKRPRIRRLLRARLFALLRRGSLRYFVRGSLRSDQ